MEKLKNMPWWVFLAYSSIESRKTALIVIWSSLLFSFYCIPWAQFTDPVPELKKYFLIDDWTWAATMFPMTFWYWLSLKWMDKHNGWLEN